MAIILSSPPTGVTFAKIKQLTEAMRESAKREDLKQALRHNYGLNADRANLMIMVMEAEEDKLVQAKLFFGGE